MNVYQEMIERDAARLGFAGIDARLVEAWMRDAQPTGCLDGLSPAQFRQEVEAAVAVLREAGTTASARLADVMGL